MEECAGILEAYTYFTGDSLKRIVGPFWVLLYVIPLPVATIVVALHGKSKSDIKSGKLRKCLDRLLNKVILASKWLFARWHLVVLHFLVVLWAVVLRIYADWRILVFSLICYVVGLLSWRRSINYPILFGRSKRIKGESEYVPISLVPGIGNSYLRTHYVAPPSGDVFLGKARFRLESNVLIFDTNEQIRYFTTHNNGEKEVDFQLPKPQNQVKSVYFLINSRNSKGIYAHQGIGEIRLVFEDAPPIVVELILGENIREWCPGNTGDFVREASSPMLTMGAWTGLARMEQMQ